MAQFQLKIKLPGISGAGHFFRRMFAELTDEFPMPNVLFWRNKDGSTISRVPEIRWIGGKDGPTLIATEAHIDALTDAMTNLTKASLKAVGKGCLDVRNAPMDLTVEDTICSYVVPSMVLHGSYAVREKFMAANEMNRRQIVKEAFVKTLRQECEVWGVDDSPLNECENQIFIQQVNVLSTAPVGNISPKVGRGLPRVRVQVLMPIKLTGRWQVGRLKSKGHGVLNRDTGQAAGKR
jgi:hypothetical protein